jgi:hypothetical protein
MLQAMKMRSFRALNLGVGLLLAIIYMFIFQMRPQTVDIMKPVWWAILFLSCHASVIVLLMIRAIRTTIN